MRNLSFNKLLIILLIMLPSLVRGQSFTFTSIGNMWYYANKGKNDSIVKNILVKTGERVLHTDGSGHLDSAVDFDFYYLDKDSNVVDRDTMIVKIDPLKNRWKYQYLDTQYNGFGDLYNPYPNHHGFIYTINPFLDEFGNRYQSQALDSVEDRYINGQCLQYYYINAKKYCKEYRIGDIIQGIGSTFYMLRTDTCYKTAYGGPLLWFYNPSFGYFIPGKTPIGNCPKTAIGNQEFLPDSISIYPNPFENEIYINLPSAGSVIKIENELGQMIYHSKAKDNILNINTSEWKKGLYIVFIYDKDKTYNIKIIK